MCSDSECTHRTWKRKLEDKHDGPAGTFLLLKHGVKRVIHNCIVSTCITVETLMCGKFLQNCFWPIINELQSLQTVTSILRLSWRRFKDDGNEEYYGFFSITKLLVINVEKPSRLVLSVSTAVCHVGPEWLEHNLACFTKQEKQWEKTHQPTTRPPSCCC